MAVISPFVGILPPGSCPNGCLNGYLCPSPGFPYTRRCRLTNSSPVPLTFQLRMSDDGTQPAVDSVDQIRRDTDPAWRKGIHFYVEPREFTMNPSQGTILPQGHQDIEVTLCSNTVMEFYRRMLVDLEGIGKGVATLILTARNARRTLLCSTPAPSPVGLCSPRAQQRSQLWWKCRPWALIAPTLSSACSGMRETHW
ncbi:hydrocephalus-inducing protein homolog [Agelaius tricolor]|uniref:hydrocephalus-inducing protein homolog n=1 Tax=Agelaius tricolor TaxID=9191 RepID=UPI0039F25788